jgi:hypothetical protein
MDPASMDSAVLVKFFEALQSAKLSPATFTLSSSSLDHGLSKVRILILPDDLWEKTYAPALGAAGVQL